MRRCIEFTLCVILIALVIALIIGCLCHINAGYDFCDEEKDARGILFFAVGGLLVMFFLLIIYAMIRCNCFCNCKTKMEASNESTELLSPVVGNGSVNNNNVYKILYNT